MGGFIGRTVGAKGCDFQSGSGTITAPNGAKITAIGIHTAANITNYKYTPVNRSTSTALTQVTVSNKGWMGSAISPSGVMDYITLEHPADSVTISTGEIMVYFD